MALLLGCIFMTSCSDDFLDEPASEEGITANAVFADRLGVEAYITGILKRSRSQHTRTDRAGLNSVYFARDLKGNDLIQRATWFATDYTFENREPGHSRPVFTWDYCYEHVNHGNVLIDGVTNSSTLDENSKREFIAFGKFWRAFHYFQLALEFAPNYRNDPSISRLPIYTNPATGESEGNPTSPLSDVFELILSDLNEAIADLPDTRIGKSYINKAVAQGVLARVLLVTMDDWEKVSSLAREVYGGDAETAVPSNNYSIGFVDFTDPEWVWALYQDEVETHFFWSAAPGMMDHDLGFFKATYINRNFVNEFSATDSRNLFADIYNSSTPYREFVSSKFKFEFEADIPLMRKSEMVLIDAEAQYHLGNESVAHDLLFALQKDRDPGAIISTNTGQDLLDEILLERRKELYGELGVEWFDAKRYRLPINRDPVHRVVVNVPVDSELLFLKIPQKEIDANPNIDASINN